MKRRLILAQALFGTPDFIILDEPLNGLDPLLIIRLRAKLMDFKKSGGTLLFSSHILAEIEKTCSQIAILHDGKLLYFETVENTLAEHGTVEGAFARLVGPSV